MLPDRAQIYVAAIEDEEYKNQKMGFWKSVYGVDMTCLRASAMKEPLIDCCESNQIVSNSSLILDLNLVKCKKEDVEFSNEYNLTMMRDDKIHGLVAWFDCQFSDLKNPVTLSTSPYKKYTHWKQTVFYMEYDMVVEKGDQLWGSIANRKSKTNFRE